MNRTLVKPIAMIVVTGISLICSATAQATTIAEWDFRVDQYLTVAANGASTSATLNGGATVNTSAAVPGALTTNPKLLNGYLDATRSGGAPDDEGDVTTATWGALYGTNNLTDGTFIGVFKMASVASSRYALLSHKVQGANGGQMWANIEQTNANTTSLVTMAVGNASAAVTIPTINSTDWYFFASSWSQGQNVQLYLKDITTGSLQTFTTGGTTIAMTAGAMTDNVYLGIRHSLFPNQLVENANARFAFAQLTNNYLSTQSAFDSLYTNLITPVPEPSSMLLVVSGFTMLFARRRRLCR